MSAFKISIDEDILLLRTSPSMLNRLIFFRHWSYALELPVKRIIETKVERRAGILTLIVVKKSKEGPNKNIAVSLAKANKKQVRFLKIALPQIIADKPPMPKIKEYINTYL
jgi:hypothetical protein